MGTASRDEDSDLTPAAATGNQVPDDAAVDLEWQRLERERIEEERAEAREDATAVGRSGLRLPWPILVAALAAGLIAAAMLNAWLTGLRPQVRPAADANGEVASP